MWLGTACGRTAKKDGTKTMPLSFEIDWLSDFSRPNEFIAICFFPDWCGGVNGAKRRVLTREPLTPPFLSGMFCKAINGGRMK
jgi:hypothetical protein